MNLVFTFSRRYGAGASRIAKDLAKKLNIPVYQKDYICRHVEDADSMEQQNELIRELAKEPCVIVGRGASGVLKDQYNVVNIYVYANEQDRLKRIMEKEHLTDINKARKQMAKVDNERIALYEANTGKVWGDFDDFDIIIDSSQYGLENCADVIIEYLTRQGDM